MANRTWSSFTTHKDGQTDWLVHLYEKSVNGIRQFGLPSEVDTGVLVIKTPTLADQARIMRYRDLLPPGNNAPTGVIEFLD